MRLSQSFFCSGVAPTVIGIAAQERGQHRGGDAQIDARHLFADAVHIEGAAAHAAELFGNKQELNAQLVRAAHVADDLQRAFVARIQLDQLFVGQTLLGEVPERFQTQFQCLVGNHCSPHFAGTLCISRILLVSSGKNSRMSSTIPTSAT